MQDARTLLNTYFKKEKQCAMRKGALYRQADFARFLGVSKATLGAWLAGKHRPSTALAMRVERNTRGQIRAADLLQLDENGSVHTETPRS